MFENNSIFLCEGIVIDIGGSRHESCSQERQIQYSTLKQQNARSDVTADNLANVDIEFLLKMTHVRASRKSVNLMRNTLYTYVSVLVHFTSSSTQNNSAVITVTL